MKIIFTPVGVTFSDTKPNLELLEVGSEVTFSHQPAFYGTGDKRKEYPNAVVILFDGKKVGSLAESSSDDSPQQSILRMIKEDKNPVGNVIEIIVPKEGDTFKKTYKLEVEVDEPKKKLDYVLKKSFNEDNVVIRYNPTTHTYDSKGTSLQPVTKFIQKYFKEFNAEQVASRCAKNWDVKQEELLELWDSNKETAQMFGTAIHNALEHYEMYEKLGAEISKKREVDTNYALPKHPILRSIIEGFIAINPIKGDVQVEQLVTSVKDGICGLADRIVVLDWDKKIARIGDYKINVGAEDKQEKILPPFAHLPANKISHYQIQLSVYANMLQANGWTVTGLDVYIYESEWKYFELEVLNVLGIDK